MHKIDVVINIIHQHNRSNGQLKKSNLSINDIVDFGPSAMFIAPPDDLV